MNQPQKRPIASRQLRVIAGCFLLLTLLLVAGGCARSPEARRDRYFTQGKQQLEQKKYEAARIQFTNATKSDPRFADGFYYLALAEHNLNRIPEAARSLQKCLDVDPNHLPAKLEMGELYLMANAPKRAREAAVEVLEREPSNYQAQVLVAKSYIGESRFKEAREELEKALALRPDDPPLHLAIGIAEIGLRRYPAAEASFRKALTLAPSSLEARKNLANLYLTTNQTAKAEAVLKEAGSGPDAPSAYLALADLYQRLDRKADIEDALQQFKGLKNHSAESLSEVGDFWQKRGDVAAATREYEASLAVAKTHLTAKKLVNSYITLGNIDAADRWNRELMALAPADPQVSEFQGAIAHLRGDHLKAVDLLRKAVREDPGSVFVRYYLGSALLARGETEQARMELFECLRLDPNFVHAHLQLGRMSLAAGDYAAAMESARQALVRTPKLADAYLILADAAIQRRQYRPAEQALNLASQLLPGHPMVLERWGAFYAARRDWARATRSFEEAASRAPNADRVFEQMVRYFVQNGGAKQAISTLARYADKPNGGADVNGLLAQLYFLQDDLAAASAASERALQKDPRNLSALVLTAQVYERQGRLAEAEAKYEAAKQAYPGELAPHLLLGELYLRSRRFEEARQRFQAALGVYSSSARAKSGLARVILETSGDTNVAFSLASEARSLAPRDREVAKALASAYYHMGMNRQAISILRERFLDAKADPELHYQLAMAYSKDGRKGDALRELQTATRLGLSPAMAEELARSLQIN